MAAFCERLFAEGDPATFAAMAEQMPEPPSLDKPVVEAPPAMIGANETEAPAKSEPVVVTDVEAEAEAPEAEATAEVAEATSAETDAPEAEATSDAPEASADECRRRRRGTGRCR